MTRPRLLDLFCGAGGAAMGYHWAGFDVIGIDVKPQPNYPFKFIQQDALDVFNSWNFVTGFDAIHASPPCQAFTAYRRKGMGVGDGYPDLIAPVRHRLRGTGLPYVIENVPDAPLRNPVLYCGSSFGLDVRRHRHFESNVRLTDLRCNHAAQKAGRFPGATNRGPMSRATVEIGVWRIPLPVQQAAMGIDWMTLEELSEAIPPAYTQLIGLALRASLDAREPSCSRPAIYDQGLCCGAPDGNCVHDRAASCDTHPKDGNSTEIEVPLVSGAVPEGQTPNA